MWPKPRYDIAVFPSIMTDIHSRPCQYCKKQIDVSVRDPDQYTVYRIIHDGDPDDGINNRLPSVSYVCKACREYNEKHSKDPIPMRSE
jgi:hypothetical protein